MSAKLFVFISVVIISAAALASCIYIELPPGYTNNAPANSVVDVRITVSSEGTTAQLKAAANSYSVATSAGGTVSRSGRTPVEINEDFSSAAINPAFVMDGRGKCDWKISNGILTMDMGGNPSDAGVLKIMEPLELGGEMTIKVRARGYNYGGAGPRPNCNLFLLAHETGETADVVRTDSGIVCSAVSSGWMIIAYRNENGEVTWCPEGRWREGFGYSIKIAPEEYYTIEFHSNGTEWSIKVSDKDGKMLAATSPVSWKSLPKRDSAWYFIMGEPSDGYYWTDMDVDYIHANYTPKNDRFIVENFDPGALDKHFVLENAGATCWKISDGVLSMKQTGQVEDAGLVVLTDNLSVSMPINIETKVRFTKVTMSGWYGYNSFCIGQRTNAPGIVGGFAGRIGVDETPEGDMRILYDCRGNREDAKKCWNAAQGKWETCTPATVSGKGEPGAFRIVEFHSDGCVWHIVIKNESGKILAKTSPVQWSDVRDADVPFQFYFGEWGTEYYSANMDVDYVRASYSYSKKPGTF